MAPALAVIGCSLGGLDALQAILGSLPQDLPVPVVVAQHRGSHADDALVQLLQARTALRVCEPDDKEPLLPGAVYVAPAGYHVLVEAGSLSLSADEPVNSSRPSIDVLFESAADTYGPRVVGVILTGNGSDGAAGAARIRARGGLLVVQDPATARASAMPDAALAATQADHVARLEEIAPLLARLCGLKKKGELDE